MDVKADRRQEQIVVAVTVTNDLTGHHVPTDSPLRQLILLVKAADEQGHALWEIDGPVVPQWGGIGDPNQGYYAGLPGKAFAKVLEEFWTENSPSGAYWNHTRILSDNRIAALAADTSTYTFAAALDGQVTIDVTLLYRRAFIELKAQKGWVAPDIVMEQEQIRVPGL
jgi:hypothetical protein